MAKLKPKDINLFLGRVYEEVKKRATVKTDGPPPEVEEDQKNIVLFVGEVYGHMIEAIRDFQKQTGQIFRIALFFDSKQKVNERTKVHLEELDLVLSCDAGSDTAIKKTLLPYSDEIVAVTCRSESAIPLLAKVIPHLPYLATPTTASLRWSTDKIAIREHLDIYDTRILPNYLVISNAEKDTLHDIEQTVGFPLVVKPSGLAASRLVSICFHAEELEGVLKKVFKRINTVHRESGGKWEPRILVEQFMEGSMYSIDGYVSGDGKIYFCPMVEVQTGRAIGFDDFFGYRQMTPTLLQRDSIVEAEAVATKAVYALGLRNTTVHIELMRMEDGWKIIEMGPRIGGFRHMMYQFSYDFNHTINDILIRMNKKPIMRKTVKGYTVAMKFFAKEEGKLTALTGVKKAQELTSFKTIYVNKKVGDQCLYAKNGGSSVFDIIMFHEDRSELLADIRRLEKMIVIETE